MGKINNYIDALNAVRKLIGTDSVCANDIKMYASCLCSKIMEHNIPEDAASYVIRNLAEEIKAESDRVICGYKVEHSSMMKDRYIQLLSHIACKLGKMKFPIDNRTMAILNIEPQPELTIPIELSTPEAKHYFNKAIELGLMDKDYKWLKGKEMLAWFAVAMSDKLNLGKGQLEDGRKRTSWKPFELLFKISDLRLNYNDILKTGRKPNEAYLIDRVFE